MWCRVPVCPRTICGWRLGKSPQLRLSGSGSKYVPLSKARNWKSKGCRRHKFWSIIDVLKAFCPRDHARYGKETRSPTKAEENTLAVTERAMARRMHDPWPYLHRMSGEKNIVVARKDAKLYGRNTLLALLTTRRRNALPIVIRRKKRLPGRSLRDARLSGGNGGLWMVTNAQYRTIWNSCTRHGISI